MSLKTKNIIIYINIKKWRNAEANTKFFLQDNMYFYKTITEQEFWAERNEIENNKNFKLCPSKKVTAEKPLPPISEQK